MDALTLLSTSIIGVITLCVAFAKYFAYFLDSDWELFFRSNVPEKKDLYTGKRIVIVGASSGIGEELAYALAKRGANLVLAARRTDRLTQVAKRCKELGAGEALVKYLDVADFDSHVKFVQDIVDNHGAVDTLVNNAGRTQRSLAQETELQVDKDMFNLNVLGIISLTRAFLPVFLKRGHGSILVTSSVAGKLCTPISSTYSATKHALQGFFHSLRTEVGSRNIQISIACPGPIKTDITYQAYVAQAGSVLGQGAEDDDSRMSASRCAYLMLKCMHHGQYECWISTNPVLFFTYVHQYLPTLAYYLAERLVGPKRVAAFKDRDYGYGSWMNMFSSPSIAKKKE